MGDPKSPVVPAKVRAVRAEPVVAWPPAGDPPSRHGAIARKLYTYSNYKSWADKMKASWVDQPAVTDVSDD